MVEFTLLTKGIFLVFLVIIIYKTKLLSVVFGFLNDKFNSVAKKLGFYNGVRKEYNVEVRQRKKFINRFVKKIKRDEEL